jgi:hypothetical protein
MMLYVTFDVYLLIKHHVRFCGYGFDFEIEIYDAFRLIKPLGHFYENENVNVSVIYAFDHPLMPFVQVHHGYGP